MKRSLSFSLTLLAAAVLAPALAHADTFTVTTSPTATAGTVPFTFTFTIPATPSGVTPIGGLFPGFEITVPVIRNGVLDSTDILTFYTTAGEGGFSDNDSSFGPLGPQLFSGTTSAPTFLLGTFNLSNEAVGGHTDYILTIAAATGSTTPEPSSLALLGTGALGLAGIVRRRLVK